MKISTYLWAIKLLGFNEGEFLSEDDIYDAYDEIDSNDSMFLKARNYLLDNIDEINEYNGYDIDDEELDEETEEEIDRFLVKRKGLNTVLFSLIFIVIGVFLFIIFKDNDLFKNNNKYLDYQLYGDTYMVSLKPGFNDVDIEIPEKYDGITITRIGSFSSNTLKHITIHANIEVINDKAFSACTALESINIPSSVNSIGESAFSNCIDLKRVSISGNITEIKEKTFYNCISLTEVNLPNSVTIIGKNAFDGCIKLKTFEMPNNIVEIHDYAFANCELINNISFGQNLYSLGDESFKNCKNLDGVLIPASITYLGDFVFKCCDNLKNFELVEGNNLRYVGENILYDTYLFKNYKESIFKKGGWVIFTKDNIGSIILKENVSKKAFYNTSSSITSIIFKEGVEYILEEAFNGISIEGLILPSSLKIIGNKAFYNNKSLKIITLEFHDPYVIYNKSIWECFGFSNDVGTIALNNNLKIYVPSALVELFKNELNDPTQEFIKNHVLPY